MRPSLLVAFGAASAVNAAYSGDIVQYWIDQSSLLLNGTIIGGLQSPPSGWYFAAVTGAILEAAVKSKDENLASQQLAVSHAAHNILNWAYHGTRNYNAVNAALRSIIPSIGLAANSTEGKKAIERGQKAAAKVAVARADDGINDFVDFAYGPKNPGVYQQTPGGNPLPDNPQARYVRSWAKVRNITGYRAPPPLQISDKLYEEQLLYVKEYGSVNSTARSAYDTDTAYFWRESSFTSWNRVAHSIVKNSLATKVVESAKLYAQLNYAFANTAIAAWETKFFYATWRPVTAIQRTDIWLPSGRNVSDPSWTPLLRPTPSHPDYVSGHSTIGGAAAAVLTAFNGGDKVEFTLSSNATLDNRGVITRTFTSLKAAAEENSKSRVFGGIHFTLAGVPGIALGDAVAKATLKAFEENWDSF